MPATQAKPSRRAHLRNQIAKVQAAEKKLASIKPVDAAGKKRKKELMKAFQQRRNVLQTELKIRETYAKTSNPKKRAALKKKYEALKAQNPKLYSSGPVGTVCIPCMKNAIAKFEKESKLKEKHFVQEKNNSCVIASTRNMIKMLTGKDVSEKQLRREMRKIMNAPKHDFNTTPINPAHALKLLKKHGVNSESKGNVAAEDLGKLVANGKPVLIGFKNPGHRVMLDSMGKDASGNPVYYVRDPAPTYKGKVRAMNEADFKKKYNDTAIVIVPK